VRVTSKRKPIQAARAARVARAGVPSRRALPLWDWQRMSERDREAAWLELNEWVSHVVMGRYALRNALPRCWHRHEALVGELVELHEREAEIYSVSRPLVERVRGWERDLLSSAAGWPAACAGPAGSCAG
jgi:hypothetical protein